MREGLKRTLSGTAINAVAVVSREFAFFSLSPLFRRSEPQQTLNVQNLLASCVFSGSSFCWAIANFLFI
jgi:hypothetical protein